MSVHRLRAITDAGTFAIEIDADRTRAQLRSETAASKSETSPSKTDRPAADETTFQIAPIDTDTVSVSVDVGVDAGGTAGSTGAGRGATSDQANPEARTFRAHVVADGDMTWVFIDGETFTIEVEPAERAKPRRGSTGNEGLAAPMPATVIKVLVEPGAEVHRGDVLLLLEAMKMELPVRAPRDGRVKTLLCRPGDLVQPGTALVELE